MSKTSLLKLLRLSREEWPLLLWGMLFLAISSTCLLIYPQSIKVIIDEAIQTHNQNQLNLAALLALGVFAIQSLTSALRYYFFTLAGEKTVKRLRAKLFSQIISQDMIFFDAQKTGELLGRLSSDTQVLQNALSVNISMLIRNLAQALGGIILLFYTSPRLTVFILMIIPPLALLAAHFGKKVKSISRLTQDALAQSSGIAEESLSGVRTVKAFAQENFEVNRYSLMLEKSFNISKLKIREITKFTSLVSLLGLSAIVFIVWYGGSLVIKGSLSVGTLTSYLLYVMTVAFSVGMLGSLWTDFMSAFGASQRIFELLDKIPDLKSQKSNHTLTRGHIEFNHVNFSYPMRANTVVLENLSFEILPQETVAIVGASGGGKSTIAQLLMRFYDVNSGEILIDGKNIQNFDTENLRKAIGLVSQEPILISESLEDNIRYGKPDATINEVITAAKLSHAHEFILKFPETYKTLVGERGVQLSGGQKQRVAIARAILKDPKILILDEATSALDSESEFLVQDALENLLGKRTTIIIAHRLSTVKKADKIIVVEHGQIVQIGKHEDLIKNENGVYRKLIERQFDNQK